MTGKKLLITGATGFIGGTILHHLLNSSDKNIQSLCITAAIRQPNQAAKLESLGVKTIIIDGLDDSDGLTKAASSHDFAINAATGQHPGAAMAIIEGLGKGSVERKSKAHFLHLSGTTSIAKPALTQTPYKLRSFSDRDQDIYDYEKEVEAIEPYGQRTADVTVVETGERCNVQTNIVMPPTVYGRGEGLFKTESHQIPTLIRNALSSGHSEYLESDARGIGNVHVSDLASLYVTILAAILRGDDLPSGRNGYYFANTGTHEWKGLADEIARVGYEQGVLKSASSRSINLDSAADKLGGGDKHFAEVCFASHSSSVPDKAYAISWKPSSGQGSCETSVAETIRSLLNQHHSMQ